MKQRKSILFWAFYILFASTLSAQREQVLNLSYYDSKFIHFGFSLGFNTMNFYTLNSAAYVQDAKMLGIYNQPSMGFNLGPISNFRLMDDLDFRVLINLSFGQRSLNYEQLKTDDQNSQKVEVYTMMIESTFIEFPLLFKYKSKRTSNVRPYVIGGGNPKIDLAARKKIKETEMPKIRLKPFDIYYEIGAGIDFYLPYFKFSTEIKYAQGLFNLLVPETGAYAQYTDGIEKITSRMLVVSLHFE